MQEDFRLILDLVTMLAAAASGGLFASLLGQPAILGYLLGGIIVGPAGLGWIKELIQVETLAQFGVALLLFALGVEFSFAELKKVKGISLGGGTLQIVLTIAVTTFVSLVMGWCTSWSQGVFLGAILSLSSTAVVLKCLMERNELPTLHGQVMLGILVVQDLALGFMLAVLPALNEPPEAIGMAVISAVVRIALFAVAALAFGLFIVPQLLRFLAKRESQELFLLGVIALCLGIALVTYYLGFSIEMGAFVAGLMISEVEYADQTLTYVEPLRDILAALFFVSVGMLIDPVFLWQNLELILGLVCLVFVGKFLIITPIVTSFGYPLRTALIVGLGLAQIGEFSFVLTAQGLATGLVSRPVYLLILGTTAVTLVVTPFVLRLVPKLLDWAENQGGLARFFEDTSGPQAASEEIPLPDRVVVCGYGRVGKKVVQLLQAHNYPLVVIDSSERAIGQLRVAGIPYIYGNAASLHVLEAAGVDQAKALAVALPDPMSTRLCLKRSLELSPELDVVVQANQEKEIELLYQLGASEVVQSEFEVSLELATHLLLGVGLPLPGIRREIEQIRSHHYLELRLARSPSEISRELQVAALDMNSKWYPLPEGSPLAGMTLEQTDLRRLSGVSLMAIRRANGEEIDYPTADTALVMGDKLLVVGQGEELTTFEQLARGEVAIPKENRSCQWLMVPEQSPITDKTLAQLDLRAEYEVQVQAIRREGQFIRFPHGGTQVQGGDRLLLCGSLLSLKRLQLWLAPNPGQSSAPITVAMSKAHQSEPLKEGLPSDRG